MQVYIVRHTKVNVPKGMCYGHYDVDLIPDCHTSFEEIKSKLTMDFDTVYSSPSQRCQKLANCFSKDVQLDSLLQEMNFGDWEGRLWSDITIEESSDWFEDFVSVAPPMVNLWWIYIIGRVFLCKIVEVEKLKKSLLFSMVVSCAAFWHKFSLSRLIKFLN